MLHYQPRQGYFGDPIPFFWNGVYHMFYLEAPPEPYRNGCDYVQIAHISTQDFLRWRKHPMALSPSPDGLDEKGCWTGSIIEKDGLFYFFYTGNKAGDPKYPQTILLATSADLDTWEKSPLNPISCPDPKVYLLEHWRDPFLFRGEDGDYYMSVTTMRRGESFWKGGALVMARSKDLVHWQVLDQYYNPGNHEYPECSQLLHRDGRWYLIISTRMKTYYRVGDSPTGPWHVAETDSFDGVNNYAMKSVGDGSPDYVMGWIQTKDGYRDDGNGLWGGTLSFPREIVRDPKGSLYVKLPDHFTGIRKNSLFDLARDAATLKVTRGDWRSQGSALVSEENTLYSEFELPGHESRYDVEMEFEVTPNTAGCGFLLQLGGPHMPGYELALDFRRNMLYFRTHTQHDRQFNGQYAPVDTSRPIRLRVIVEGTVIEAFVNDRYALCSRFYYHPRNPKVGFFVEEGTCRLRSLSMFSLIESGDELEDDVFDCELNDANKVMV